MKVLIVIPARGGSKGLKNKNILPLMGKPLIGYTIDAAKESHLTDKIVISTEDQEIAQCATGLGVQVIDRPPEFSADDSPIEHALRHAVRHLEKIEGYRPEIVIWLQANVPLRKPGQIDTVINRLIKCNSDSVLTVTEVTQRPEFMKKMDCAGRITHVVQSKEYQRQGFAEPLYIADGAVIAMKTDILMGTEGKTGAHVYLGDDIRGVVQEPRYAIEIDDQFDFDIVMGLLMIDKSRT